jgi:cell division protein FtsW
MTSFLPKKKPVSTVGLSDLPLKYVAMLASVLMLLLAGAVAVVEASGLAGAENSGNRFHYILRHIAAAALAIILLLITLHVDYKKWRKLAGGLVFVSFLTLIAVEILGSLANGSRRWIDLGPLNFQPSELLKLTTVIGLASFLAQRRSQIASARKLVVPVMVALGAVGFVIAKLQSDLGTAMLLAVIVVGMLFVSGVPIRFLLWPLSGVTAFGAMFIASVPYRRGRMVGLFNPSAYCNDETYQVCQAMATLANGGLTGTGFGSGQAKWGYVPASHTDFVFAVIGEELGFLGGVVIIGLLGVLSLLGFRTAQEAPDFFGSLLAAGITIWFTGQTFINLGGVLGLMPVTGIVLPFISYGGSALLATVSAAGILLNIARQSG